MKMDIFLLVMVIFCFSFGDAYMTGRRIRCYKDPLNPAANVLTNVSIVSLSRNGYKNEVELAESYAGDTSLETVCYCRYNHDPIFFLAPNPETPGDTISAFCTVGDASLTSLGIHDEAELFDTLLFKRINTVSKSVMDPLPKNHGSIEKNGVVCNDYFGNPTKPYQGEQTCLMVVYFSETTRHFYAGPFKADEIAVIARNGSKVDFNNILSLCHTSFNDSILKNRDKCFAEARKEWNSFICCCADDRDLCNPAFHRHDHDLVCFGGEVTELIEYSAKILPIAKFHESHFKHACAVNISLNEEEGQTNSASDTRIFYVTANFITIDTCSKSVTFSLAPDEKMCSTELHRANITMTKCCTGDDFCNFDLRPPKYTYEFKSWCSYKPVMSIFLDEADPSCQSFYPLNDVKNTTRFMIIENLNGNILYKKAFHLPDLFLVIAKIIRVDECDNGAIFLNGSNDYYQPIWMHSCNQQNCDESVDVAKLVDEAYEMAYTFFFSCQTKNKSETELQLLESENNWFCYVQITRNDDEGEIYIEAGHIDLTISSVFIECFEGNVMDPDFCCVDISTTPQENTNCTIEKLLAFSENHDDPLNLEYNSPGFSNSFIRFLSSYCNINYLNKYLKCPASDGCFEIRDMTSTETDHVYEPTGCVAGAENYMDSNKPVTSLSLACLGVENSNRCSVVSTPEGQRSIVCCCDDKKLCSKAIKKLPDNVGMPISVFKSGKE